MRRLALLAALLAAASPAAAQAPAGAAAGALTLDRAFDLATRGNPSLAAAHESVVQADLARKRARSALLPTITAQGNYTRNQNEVSLDPKLFNPAATGPPIVIQALNTLSASARLHVPLFDPLAITTYVGDGTDRVAARLSFQSSHQQLLLSVARAYYDLASAQEALQVAEQNRTTRAAHLDKEQTLLANGAAVPTAVTQAELDVSDADAQILDANAAVEGAREELRVLCRIEGPFAIVLPELPGAAQPVDEHALVREALTRRPDLGALEVEAGNASVIKWEARARYAPVVSFDLTGSWSNAAGFAGHNFLWTGMLNATWTLLDGGARQAAVRERESQLRVVKLQVVGLKDRVQADVHDGQVQADRAYQRWLLARHQVELTGANEAAVKTRFDAGAATPLELSDAEARRLTAEIAEVTSRNTYQLALAVRDVAIGRDLSKR